MWKYWEKKNNIRINSDMKPSFITCCIKEKKTGFMQQ